MITIKRECIPCGGTGLYAGFGESKDTAVVCHTCSGTGEETVKILDKPFTRRKKRKGIKKVYETNPGWKLTSEMKGGLLYKDWLNGRTFRGTELRDHVCPCWWYQNVNYERKPKWEECFSVNAFKECKCFKNKDKCWERFDKEKL